MLFERYSSIFYHSYRRITVFTMSIDSQVRAVCILLILVLQKGDSASLPNKPETWKSDWFASGQRSVEEMVNQQLNTNVARNVIFFLGDGMGVSTVTAGRIYMGQNQKQGEQRATGEEHNLAFDKFPYSALAKTYNVDFQVPDSAGTATAFLCGVKANLGTLGVNQDVRRNNCTDMTEDTKVESILRWSLDTGKRTGIVTTTRITHATPAASYSHSPDRDWESNIPTVYQDTCSDIAKQLVFNNSDINVILGGGRQMFLPTNAVDPEYGDKYNGSRLDGLDLTQEWLRRVRGPSPSARYVWSLEQFNEVDPENTDHLLGLFAPSHLQFELDRKKGNVSEPSLEEMTEKAIRILRRGDKGYFLLVEGGRIDHGHHINRAKAALEDVAAFSRAIDKAVSLTDQSDTLIVVTADHSHVFTISGYPTRGNPILGFVDELGSREESPIDQLPYLTLTYANGPSDLTARTNLTGIDTESDNFTQPVAVPMKYETHGGEDVAVYARGPMAHLFRGVQEQNYIAHAMAYASCVGPNAQHCAAPAVAAVHNQAAYLRPSNLNTAAAALAILLSAVVSLAALPGV